VGGWVGGWVGSHRVQDGAQDDLVGAALHDDLHVPLQQAGLCEELGLRGEGLGGLHAVRLALERGALQTKAVS